MSPRPPGQRTAPARRTGWAALVPLVALGAGLLFALSFQANRSAGGTGLRAEGRDLSSQIQARNDRVERLSRQVSSLEREIEQLQEAQAPHDTQHRTLIEQADATAPTVGTMAVRGSGLEVVLDDAHRDPATLPPGYTVDDIVVHQQDVQGVVNALWSGGAEAIKVMDQRIIATSAVRCVGNTLLLQGRVYSPPFTITAIGDEKALRAALDREPSVRVYRQYVTLLGLGYQVTRHDVLELPAYTGPVTLNYAKAS